MRKVTKSHELVKEKSQTAETKGQTCEKGHKKRQTNKRKVTKSDKLVKKNSQTSKRKCQKVAK